MQAKAFRTFIRVYSLFKSERLSASIKFTLHKALIRSVMTYASPGWEFCGHPSNEIAVPAKQGTPHNWQFGKVHYGSRFAHGFRNSYMIT
jgi:hypothetical protein